MLSGIFLFLFAPLLNAQTEKKDSKVVEDKCNKELILGVPKVSEKNLFLLTETVPKIKGLKYIDFCEKDKFLLLKYDQEIFLKPEDVIKAFQQQNIVMLMLVKVQTFKDVKEMCAKKITK